MVMVGGGWGDAYHPFLVKGDAHHPSLATSLLLIAQADAQHFTMHNCCYARLWGAICRWENCADPS